LLLIDTIRFITTQETNPYRNLALEEYLLKQVSDREVIPENFDTINRQVRFVVRKLAASST
jgi:lipoate-protein ligase A